MLIVWNGDAFEWTYKNERHASQTQLKHGIAETHMLEKLQLNSTKFQFEIHILQLISYI